MPTISKSANFSLERSEAMLRVILPSRKNWFFLIISGFWLALWSAIGFPTVGTGIFLSSIYFPSVLFDSQNISEFGQGFTAGGYVLLLFLVWVGLWVASGGYILYDFFYQLVGYEILDVSQKSIILTKQIFRFRRAKVYSAELIQDLRIVPHSRHFWKLKKSKLASNECAMAFNYEDKTYLFGTCSNVTETRQIMLEIEKCFSHYQKASS